MPFVLDYDGAGNVIGGHVVPELQQNPLLAAPYYGPHRNPLYIPPLQDRTLPKLPHEQRYHHQSAPDSRFQRPNPHPQPHFSSIYQVPSRSPSPVQSKGVAFLNSFTKHFAHDTDTMVAFQALFEDYNEKNIDEAEFYVGIFMLISRTDSTHLVPELMEVLPVPWQAEDLTWLHQTAEALHKEHMVTHKSVSPDVDVNDPLGFPESASSDTMESGSSGTREDSSSGILEHLPSPPEDTPPPAKRTKKRPINGFRTSDPIPEEESQPMFVDPAALMIHQPVMEAMPDLNETPEISMPDTQSRRKGLVKLKLKNPSSAAHQANAPRRASRKASTKSKKAYKTTQETAEMDENIDEPALSTKSGQNEKKSSLASPTRKGRVRYGDMFAADIAHFGHFPTRRAVIARTSRPYVHLACGKGFAHPMDVKHHHGCRERKDGAARCPGKGSVPSKTDHSWDAHPSARLSYPDLNYTKVKDGFVILDQTSRDKLDTAIASGLQYLSEHKSDVTSSISEEGSGESMQKGIEETDSDNTEIEMATEEPSIKATEFGLRKKSTKTSYQGA